MYKGREIADYLDDVRNAITDVEEFTRGMDFERFAADKKDRERSDQEPRSTRRSHERNTRKFPQKASRRPLEKNGRHARRADS